MILTPLYPISLLLAENFLFFPLVVLFFFNTIFAFSSSDLSQSGVPMLSLQSLGVETGAGGASWNDDDDDDDDSLLESLLIAENDDDDAAHPSQAM